MLAVRGGVTAQFLCENRYLTQALPPAQPVTSPSKPRRLVKAKFDFEATSPDELSFKKGDALTVLNGDDKHWLWASLQGQAFTGFVPASLVEDAGLEMSERAAAAMCKLPRRFHRSAWLHGKLDRKEAATLLEDKAVGAFLLRESTSPGDYALTFKVPSKIQHFKIAQKGMGRYECGGRSFDCLEAIVLRYKEDPLMDETCLRYPIAPRKVRCHARALPWLRGKGGVAACIAVISACMTEKCAISQHSTNPQQPSCTPACLPIRSLIRPTRCSAASMWTETCTATFKAWWPRQRTQRRQPPCPSPRPYTIQLAMQ